MILKGEHTQQVDACVEKANAEQLSPPHSFLLFVFLLPFIGSFIASLVPVWFRSHSCPRRRYAVDEVLHFFLLLGCLNSSFFFISKSPSLNMFIAPFFFSGLWKVYLGTCSLALSATCPNCFLCSLLLFPCLPYHFFALPSM